ncbi:hypothetical protein J5X84_26090 [Streptosporangiaceae bacterium NEAU-GS5]|nr:hypothetical protein [Streptosporangiaceae bacterium NEAU-GS5]
MKRTFIAGGVGAGLLAAALTVSPAQAADHSPGHQVPSRGLADNYAAQQIATFWFGENSANLIAATPYNVETKVTAKHVSTGGPSADDKPGIVPAIGEEPKSGGTSKNINLPRTSGKVFFIGADHRPHWCTATSVQSNYHNLVATAGHCVYDTVANDSTLDKWVFVPGYYQGKTPWGIYVGKQAYTHYDFDVYEDGDRDYAFVVVHNGVLPTFVDRDRHFQSRPYDHRREAERALKRLTSASTTGYSDLRIVEFLDVNELDVDHGKVTVATWDQFHKFNPDIAPTAADRDKPAAPGTAYETTEISKEAYNHPDGEAYISQDRKTLFFSLQDGGGSWRYFKRTFTAKFDLDYKITGRLLSVGLKDVGRLGDNVGGQGLAYNQKMGRRVFVFGYPSGSHPDGNHAFTGNTLKWTYGTTFPAAAAAIHAEELIGVRSSFTGEGAIGSSWLLNYRNTTRLGYLNGVTIGVSDTDANNRYDTSISPYFDGELYGVYSVARNLWSGTIVAPNQQDHRPQDHGHNGHDGNGHDGNGHDGHDHNPPAPR